MELESKFERLVDEIEYQTNSSFPEQIARELIFTYILADKKFGDDCLGGVDATAYRLAQTATKSDLMGVYSDVKEYKNDVYSCVENLKANEGTSKYCYDDVDMHETMRGFSREELLGMLNLKTQSIFREESTPASVIDLVLSVARYYGISGGTVTDMCCGNGDFLMKASKTFDRVEGVEIAWDSCQTARMRIYANDINGTVRQRDCFFDSWKSQTCGDSDLVFAHYPWKLSIRSIEAKDKEFMINSNANRFWFDDKSATDFYFLSAMMNYLRGYGKGLAIGLVPLSALSNINDQKTREHMVERGLLKAVITLPDSLLYNTTVACAMVVLSNEKTEKVALFDGSEYFNMDNRIKKTINVEELMKAFAEKVESGECLVTREEMAKRDFSFSPKHYSLDVQKIIPHQVELGDVAEVFTGWQCPSAKLEALHRTDGSGIMILQMSNVENGTIVNTPEKYDVPTSSYSKFKVNKGDVVISTKSLKVKSAVVDIATDEPLMASGSIMVIRPISGKLDPYYLVSFFESEFGQSVLQMYQTGSVIPNLSIGNVKKIPLAGLPIEEQKKIGQDYKALRDNVNAMKEQLRSLQAQIKVLLNPLWDENDK